MVKKITAKEQKYKVVKDGLYLRTMWEARDGSLHYSEYAAKTHEELLERQALKTKCAEMRRVNVEKADFTDLWLDYLPLEWTYISNEEELDTYGRFHRIEGIVPDGKGSTVKLADGVEFVVGDWYAVSSEYGGDFGDTQALLSLRELRKRMNLFLWCFVDGEKNES